MLDAIDTKLDSAELHDDLVWPALDEAVTFAEAGDKTSMRTYWSGIRERYRFESAEANLTDRGLSSQLPSNWSVVSLHLSSERDSLVLVKHGRDVEPVVFKLPLDRHARREGDEEEDAFTYEIAIGELHEIIEGNNRTSRNGKFAIEKEQRQEWWRERKELNERMKVLTERMEDTWLGAFKVRRTLVRTHTDRSSERVTQLAALLGCCCRHVQGGDRAHREAASGPTEHQGGATQARGLNPQHALRLAADVSRRGPRGLFLLHHGVVPVHGCPCRVRRDRC